MYTYNIYIYIYIYILDDYETISTFLSLAASNQDFNILKLSRIKAIKVPHLQFVAT